MRTPNQKHIYNKLSRDKEGKIKDKSFNNYLLIVDEDVNLQPRRNLLSNINEWPKLPPWRADENGYLDISNRDLDNVALYMRETYGMSPFMRESIRLALHSIAEANKYHPVKEYLESLEWDGVPRMETLFTDYLGVEDTPLMRELTSLWLLAAVKRIYDPGCKVDVMIILQGPQGCGKSTMCAKLGRKWFTDDFNFLELKDKTAAEKLKKKWIIEAGELTGLRRAEQNLVKSFISRQEDYFRAPYARVAEEHPRHCVFIGTTNESAYLFDATGNRRWWPLRCDPTRATKDVFSLSEADIGQVWAEVYAAYLANPKVVIDVTEPDLKEELLELQASVTITDDREGLIANFLDICRPDNWDKLTEADRVSYIRTYTDKRTGTPPQEITLMEIHVECLGRNRAEMNPQRESRDYRRILESLGWQRQEKKKRHPVYGPQYFYSRPGPKPVETLEQQKIA